MLYLVEVKYTVSDHARWSLECNSTQSVFLEMKTNAKLLCVTEYRVRSRMIDFR